MLGPSRGVASEHTRSTRCSLKRLLHEHAYRTVLMMWKITQIEDDPDFVYLEVDDLVLQVPLAAISEAATAQGLSVIRSISRDLNKKTRPKFQRKVDKHGWETLREKCKKFTEAT